jgi:hypothetical protein
MAISSSKDPASIVILSTVTVSIVSTIIYRSESTGINFIAFKQLIQHERFDTAPANDHCRHNTNHVASSRTNGEG